MVVSLKENGSQSEFELLLNECVRVLSVEARNKPELYKSLLGRNLEHKVHEVLNEVSLNTSFYNSFELISGQKFPDIVAKVNENRLLGVEVKTTTFDHWKSTGNSVLEGTRVDHVERIYLLFGKMISPCEFIARPYEECLSEVVVTHSPRYLIDMKLSSEQTIFRKLKIGYDELRLLENPVQPIVEYYKKQLQPGEYLWWMDSSSVEEPTNIKIRFFNQIDGAEKKNYLSEAMVLFPEIFNKKNNFKYEDVALWLLRTKGIISTSLRDSFSAGGYKKIVYDGISIKIPRVFYNACLNIKDIQSIVLNTERKILSKFWNRPCAVNPFDQWISIVEEHLVTNYPKNTIPLKQIFLDHLES